MIASDIFMYFERDNECSVSSSFHFIEHRSEHYIIVECQLESEIVLPLGSLEVSGQ